MKENITNKGVEELKLSRRWLPILDSFKHKPKTVEKFKKEVEEFLKTDEGQKYNCNL